MEEMRSFAGYRRYKLDMRENLLRSIFPLRAADCFWSPGRVVSEARLGAASLSRQEHIPESGAVADRRVFQRNFVSALRI